MRIISVTLRANVAQYTASLRAAGAQARALGDEMNALGRDHPERLKSLATAVGGLGLGLVAVAGVATYAAIKFDKEMSSVQSATRASGAEMGKLRQAALDAGAATMYSATEAAKAETELAKAGLTTSQILTGGLKGALSLAAAGSMDVGEAAETAAMALQQFGLSGSKLPHVADLLAAGAGNAMGEVHDLGMALKQSGLVANQFGISIESNVAALSAFAAAGLVGSDAGTSLKTMLLALANPSKESAAMMRELGINAYDASGKFVGLENLAEQLKTKMSGLTQAQRDQALAQIFGNDAVRAANVLYKEGGAGMQSWGEKTNQAGAAADMAAMKTDNLAGDLERLKGSLETLAISSGSGVQGGLRSLTSHIQGLVDVMGALPGPVQHALTVIAGVGGIALLAAAGFLKIKVSSDAMMVSMAQAGTVSEATATRVQAATTKLGKGAAAVAGAVIGLQVAGAAVGAFFDDAPPKVTELSKGLTEFGRSGRVASGSTKALGDDVGELRRTLSALDTSLGAKVGHGWSRFVEGLSGTGDTKGAFGRAKADIDRMDEALAALVSSGHADEAKAAFDRLAEAAARQGVSLPELKKGFDDYGAAVAEAGTQQDASARSAGALAEQQQTLAGSLDAAITKAGSLKDAFDRLNGVNLNAVDATIAAEAAVDKLRESLDTNGRSLDMTTEKGRNNMGAISDMARAARDAGQAEYDLAVSQGDQANAAARADKVVSGYRDQLKNMLIAAGVSRDKVDNLATALFGLPKHVATTVELYGVDISKIKLGELGAALRNIPSEKRVTVIQAYRADHPEVAAVSRNDRIARRWGGVTEHAESGLLRDAALYSATAPARYAFAESATGGEAFVPKYGDYGRSMSILSTAARWYGAAVVPAGGGTTVHVTVNAGVGTDGHRVGAQIAEALRPYVAARGGSVQAAITGRR